MTDKSQESAAGSWSLKLVANCEDGKMFAIESENARAQLACPKVGMKKLGNRSSQCDCTKTIRKLDKYQP